MPQPPRTLIKNRVSNQDWMRGRKDGPVSIDMGSGMRGRNAWILWAVEPLLNGDDPQPPYQLVTGEELFRRE